jgi:hypothetical protein
VALPTSTGIFGRARYEFRCLWDLFRVRAFACLLNLGGVAAGLALSWGEDDLAVQIGATVGAMLAASAIAVAGVFLFSLAIASRRITDERLTALEKARVEGAQPEKAAAPIYIQIVGDVRIDQIEARSASDGKSD